MPLLRQRFEISKSPIKLLVDVLQVRGFLFVLWAAVICLDLYRSETK